MSEITPSVNNATLSAMERSVSQLQSSSTPELAAEKVESMFASMLIKTLRETLGEEGLFPGDKSDALGSMFDQYLGDEIARGRGLGLAKALAVGAKLSAEGDNS